MRTLAAIALALVALGPLVSSRAGEDQPAVGADGPAGIDQAPVHIRSDTLKVLQKKNSALFEGQVVAKQGDLTIRCQRLEVRYKRSAPGQASERGDIDSMIFSGDVQIEQALRRGHCERAEYDRPAGQIVCTGDPWVKEGGNHIRGTRIVYLLRRDEVRVSQPKAVIQLPDERKKKKVR